MTMGLSAAIRIAHASSKYGFVFARRGITMESNSSFFLPRLIGYSNALYLLTTGDVYRGDSKHFGSLFQEVIEDAPGVLKRALELASNIADKTSALAGFMNRELMWRGKPSAEETHLLDSAVLYHMFANRYARETPSWFAEKLTCTGIARKVCKASWRSERPSSRRHSSKTDPRSIPGTATWRRAREHASTRPASPSFEAGEVM
jgi:enoyl-CoA hydratase/carnithine racemase